MYHNQSTHKGASYSLPQFESGMYEMLPKLIQDLCSTVPEGAERDAALLSILVACSTVLPNVSLLYDGKPHSVNLNAFIVGKPATGKGSIGIGPEVLRPIENTLMDRHRSAQSNGVSNSAAIRGYSGLVIGGRVTRAALVENLAERPGGVLLASSEADTVSLAIRAEHGGFSAEIRQAFHNESITNKTRTQDSFTIVRSRLSIILAGTPDQVVMWNNNGTQNGLYSRFLYYLMPDESDWRNPFGTQRGDQIGTAHQIGYQLLPLYDLLCKRDTDLSFDPQSFDPLNLVFQAWEVKAVAEGEDWFQPSIRRGCLLAARIAMTLSMLRIVLDQERKSRPGGIELEAIRTTTKLLKVEPIDLKIAEHIVADVCLRHSLLLGRTIEKLNGESALLASLATNDRRRLWEALPEVFSTKDFQSAVSELGISQRTARGWQKDWIDRQWMERLRRGEYRKLVGKDPH